MSSVIKKSNVQLTGHAAAPGARTPLASAPTCASRVRPLRIGGVVAALEITCTCGETTLVELDYPQASEERDGKA
jgi:hypothetical protein